MEPVRNSTPRAWNRDTLACVWLIALLSSIASPAAAQGFNPASWFPMELGNAWHYQNFDQLRSWVVRTERDSVVGDLRWVHFDEIYCAGNCNPDGAQGIWYALTDDHYLIYDLDDPDTLLATVPNAFFEVDQPEVELTMLDANECLGSDGVLRVGVWENSRSDSTRFRLYTDSGIYCSLRFRYNIGISTWNGTELEGARVNGIEFGRQDVLATVLSTDRRRRPSTSVSLFPSPFADHLNVRVESIPPTGADLTVFDMLGRVVLRRPVSAAEVRIDTTDLPAGLYVVVLSGGDVAESRTVLKAPR